MVVVENVMTKTFVEELAREEQVIFERYLKNVDEGEFPDEFAFDEGSLLLFYYLYFDKFKIVWFC